MSAGRAPFSFAPALQLMGGRLVGFAATFFVPIVLVRVFEPELFGTYKQLFLVYTTLFSLAQIGMAESLFYFLPQRPEKSGRLLVNSFLMLALSGAAALAFLWLFDSRIAAWLSNPEVAGHLPWIGLYLLLMLASAGLEIALLCRRRYLGATASYALSDILRAVFLVVPTLVFGDLRWLLAGAVVFAAGRLGIFLALLGQGYRGSLRPDRGLLARQLAYSLPFQAAVVVEVAQVSLHQYAVAYWFDAATFAIYAVGCLQIPLVEFAASSAGNVLMVGMGGALKEGDREGAREIWAGTTRKLALLLAPATVVLLVAGPDLIPFLFTERYAASVPIFMVWTVAVILGAVQTDAALRTYAEVRFLLVMNLVRLALIAGSIYWAVSALGLVGAVAVTVAGTLVAKGLALGRLRRCLGTGWAGVLPWGDLARITGVSVAAALPPALLWPGLERGTFATLAILGTTYAAALALLVWRLRILTPGETAAAGRLARRTLRLAPRRIGARPPGPQPSEPEVT